MEFAIAIKRDESGYRVLVPDLPGCEAGGATLAEAKERIKAAVLEHCSSLASRQQPLPRAKAFATWASSTQLGRCDWNVVRAPIESLFGKRSLE